MSSSFTQNNLEPGLIILLTLVFYYGYYYLSHSNWLTAYVRKYYKSGFAELATFISKKFLGFLFLALLPGIIYFLHFGSFVSEFGLSIAKFTGNIHIILGLVLIIAFFLYFLHKGKPSISTIQMKFPEWNILLFLINTVAWIIYLFSYEFLFRGILLFACFNHFGFATAIAINITIYSAIHMVYGKEQAIGALIFGAIACYFTLERGTILIPVFMHAALSILSDYYSIRFNPGLQFVPQIKFTIPTK